MCPFWVIALGVFGAICMVTLPIYALYVFAVKQFADADEITHIGQIRPK